MLKNKLRFILFLAVMVILTGCAAREESQVLISEELLFPETANYRTAKVEKTILQNTVRGGAFVQYLKTELTWENSNARFRDVLVSKGDEVKKGDVLAVFDIDASKVELESLNLELLRAEEDYARGKIEQQTGINELKEQLAEGTLTGNSLQITELNLQKLETAYERFVYQSEKNIQKLQKDLVQLKEQMKECTLTAPYDGIIVSVMPYSKGDKVTVGKTLITMYAPDVYLLAVSEGAEKLPYHTEITLEAGPQNAKKEYSGVVISSPEIMPDGISQNYALIKLDEELPASDLRDKYRKEYSYTAYTNELQEVLTVPKSAVHSENGKQFVYLLENGTVQKRYVVTGWGNIEKIWILDGLTEGQTLILD